MINIKNINWKGWLPWALLAIAVTAILLFVFRKVPLPGEDPAYEYLQHQNDSLLQKNSDISRAFEARKKTVDSLEYVVDTIDRRIKIIKEAYEKKIPVFDSYTPEQLERYLTERYSKP